MDIIREFILELLYVVPSVLLALTVHEVAHGFMAYKLGDPTARNLGRLSLNPLKHIDPIGALCMVLFRFGWAKPVPINTRHFKKPRRDMALTAAAGPTANFLMAFVALFLFHIVSAVSPKEVYVCYALPDYLSQVGFGIRVLVALLNLLSTFAALNIGLGVFNLIPVPPLDGSRIFLTFLPSRIYFKIMQYERYIMLGLFALLFIGRRFPALNFIGSFMSLAIEGILSGMDQLISLIPGL